MKRLKALLRAAAGLLYSGNGKRLAPPDAASEPEAASVRTDQEAPAPAPADPELVTMFLKISLDSPHGPDTLFCKLTMDRTQLRQPDCAGNVIARLRRYFESRNCRITGLRPLSYDQYLACVARCPDQEPEDIYV